MKKYLAAFTVLCALAVSGPFAYAAEGDIISYEQGGGTKVVFGVTSASGTIYNEEGLVNIVESFIDVPAISTSAYGTVAIATGALISATTNIPPQRFRQPSVPTVITMRFGFDHAESSAGVVGATVTVSGFDAKGTTRTETVIVSTNFARTQNAYSFISTVSIPVVVLSTNSNSTAFTTAYLAFGSTGTYGLVNDLKVPSDVITVTEQNMNISSATINANTDTFTPTTPPNGSVDYILRERIRQSPPPYRKPGQ